MKQSVLPPSLAPIGLSRVLAAEFIGVSAVKFDEMVNDSRMPQPRRVDGRKVWDRRLIEEAFSELPMAESGPNPWNE